MDKDLIITIMLMVFAVLFFVVLLGLLLMFYGALFGAIGAGIYLAFEFLTGLV